MKRPEEAFPYPILPNSAYIKKIRGCAMAHPLDWDSLSVFCPILGILNF